MVHGHLHEGAALAAVLGRLFGRPAVADLQGSLTGELIDHHTIPARGPLPALARILERAIVRGPTRLLASSTSFARELAERWGGGDRVVALPDGVDPEVFRPGLPADDLRRALRLEGRRVVVFLGVLTPYQGVDDLLAAWPAVVAAVPDAHLLLMGYPNDARYRDAVARAGLDGSVTVTGRIDYREAPRYLALGDVAVSPKRSATEANGKLPQLHGRPACRRSPTTGRSRARSSARPASSSRSGTRPPWPRPASPSSATPASASGAARRCATAPSPSSAGPRWPAGWSRSTACL